MLSTSFCAVPDFRRVEPVGLRPHHRRDRHLRFVRDRRIRVAGDGRRRAAQPARIAQCANHIRRAPGGRQPHHHIDGGEVQRPEIGFAQSFVVFRPFHRFKQRARPAGDQPHHHAVRHAEGRRALGGIQHAQAAAGAGAQINQPPTGLQRRRGQIDRLRDRRQHLFDRLRHLAVFLVKAATISSVDISSSPMVAGLRVSDTSAPKFICSPLNF